MFLTTLAATVPAAQPFDDRGLFRGVVTVGIALLVVGVVLRLLLDYIGVLFAGTWGALFGRGVSDDAIRGAGGRRRRR